MLDDRPSHIPDVAKVCANHMIVLFNDPCLVIFHNLSLHLVEHIYLIPLLGPFETESEIYVHDKIRVL